MQNNSTDQGGKGFPGQRRIDPFRFPSPPRPGSISIPTTVENVAFLVDELGYTVRQNVIKKTIEITTTDENGNSVPVHNSTIASAAIFHGMNVNMLSWFMQPIAEANPSNPAAEWIRSKSWDGVDRLPDFYNTVTTAEGYPPGLKEILLYRWMLSIVAAALEPFRFKSRGVLTFQGKQGIGKTRWGQRLVNDEKLRADLVKEDHHLNPTNKDSVLGAISHWIAEIAELEGSFKRDMSKLKGFITKDCDKIRAPYGREPIVSPRRTVFYGTVNDPKFLVDTTGNTRWWTIPVTALDHTHDIDMQQVFAQLAIDHGDGVQWWLTDDEEAMLERLNRDHRVVSAIGERIEDVLDLELKTDPHNPAMTPTEFLTTILGMARPTNAQCRDCGAALRELLGDPKRIQGRDKWRIPLRRGSTGEGPPPAPGEVY
ncbi:VapE domain-containing protein [Parasphingorhabdus sp.]|uniref:VapE domain-containing protein n=1 Tax=Parasphingorhabdus sp. TaxID=2709688 RepID=UPI0030014EF3